MVKSKKSWWEERENIIDKSLVNAKIDGLLLKKIDSIWSCIDLCKQQRDKELKEQEEKFRVEILSAFEKGFADAKREDRQNYNNQLKEILEFVNKQDNELTNKMDKFYADAYDKEANFGFKKCEKIVNPIINNIKEKIKERLNESV